MGTVGAIAVFILTPVLWILSHKYFRFIYFGNVGNAIIKEIIECFFIALIIVSIVGAAGGAILTELGAVLKFLLKALLIVGGIVLVLLLIKKITSSKSGKSETATVNTSDANTETSTIDNDTPIQNDDEIINETKTTVQSDFSVEDYIKQNFTKENYVEALKYYREKTNADFNTAKAVVDNLLASK